MQVIVVVVEADTMHGILSIITVLSEGVGENEVPVNVTSVPPKTLPNLGSIFVRIGVADP